MAVTPFESVKTQLIDDQKRSQPRMKGFLHGSAIIAREKGIAGFFQGFVPSTARQGANSMVRFSSYTFFKRHTESASPGPMSAMAAGALAGIVTV